jgi:hypothetical protein
LRAPLPGASSAYKCSESPLVGSGARPLCYWRSDSVRPPSWCSGRSSVPHRRRFWDLGGGRAHRADRLGRAWPGRWAACGTLRARGSCCARNGTMRTRRRLPRLASYVVSSALAVAQHADTRTGSPSSRASRPVVIVWLRVGVTPTRESGRALSPVTPRSRRRHGATALSTSRHTDSPRVPRPWEGEDLELGPEYYISYATMHPDLAVERRWIEEHPRPRSRAS